MKPWIFTVLFAVPMRCPATDTAANWGLASRTLEMNQRLTRQSSGDYPTFQQFLAAQNQERAGQFAPAVASYLAALRSGSLNIPVDFIGERLAAIEKEHPEEYQAAMESSGGPSMPRKSESFSGSRTTPSKPVPAP